MDDKIIEGLNNMDVTETDQLLDSIDTKMFGKEVDKSSINRIKKSVFKKAGATDSEVKQKIIPNKARLFSVALVISIIELLFFTASAFIAWMGGVLEKIGNNLSISGILSTIFYIVTFAALSLSAYMAMFNIDSEKYTKDMFIPKNRTYVVYTAYFIFSVAIKIALFKVAILCKDEIDIQYYFDHETQIKVIISVIFIAILIVLDMFLAKLKNLILLKCEGTSLFTCKWKLGLKAFALEIIKFVLVFVYLAIYSLIQAFSVNDILANVIGLTFLFCVNILVTLVVQMKKRNSLQIEQALDKASDDNKASDKNKVHNEFKAESTLKQHFIRHRFLVFGLYATALIYLVVLLVPYLSNYSMMSKKPMLVAFSNNDEVKDFFAEQKLPFTSTLNIQEISRITETLFKLNRFFASAAIFEADMSFGGRLSGGIKDSGGISLGSSSLNIDDPQFMSGIREDEFLNTNTHVKNVDEADVIKTDGKNIYYLNQSKMYIAEANPSENMKIVYQYDFSEEGFYPIEMFLYKQHITVILMDKRDGETDGIYSKNFSKTYVRTYNINNTSSPILERSFKLDYPYLTSRMIENNLYLVTNAPFDDFGNSIPLCFDTALDNSVKQIDYENLFLMKGNTTRDYQQIYIVASIPVDDPKKEAKVKGYIGVGLQGENVYVSNDYIYITEDYIRDITEASVKDFFGTITSKEDMYLSYYVKYETNIYRIKIQDGDIGDVDSAFIPGLLHNQFSIDEYDGYFRLTTLKSLRDPTSSGVYVFDSTMNLCGSLEGIAPEERIFSSRFVGDRVYLVTFKDLDPLFVISLKNPKKPTALGKLRIPGYIKYLQPLDENHIIGFGKDSKSGDENFSWYQGIKMAIFDVSDVNDPKEKFVEIIGDKSSDSEILYNHKSLMFMKSLGLMAFPLTLHETNEGAYYGTEYGEFSYQGAYVYNVSSDEGFKLRGRITHLGPDILKNTSNAYDKENSSFINRIVYANQTLYTFSEDKVKATRYNEMTEISQIPLE